jgi:hypothetical protein
MRAILLVILVMLALGLIGGASQGNLPFQNGNGWQGAPQAPVTPGG